MKAHHDMNDLEIDEREALVAGTVSMAVLAVGLTVTLAGVPMAWTVWPLGYGLVLPLAITYAKQQEEKSTSTEPDRLAETKRRYVEGEVDEATFEDELEAALDEDEL